MWAETRKYLKTRLFAALNALALVLLLVYSLLIIGAERVGLMEVTYFDYLIGALNTYMVTILPFSLCLFGAYTVVSEYQWRTIVWIAFDGLSRLRWISQKALLCVLIDIVLPFAYVMPALLIARFAFPFASVLVEHRFLGPSEALLRLFAACLWVAIMLLPFALLALVLAVITRSTLVSGMGSAMVYYIALIVQNTGWNPLRPLFQVARDLVQSANLQTPDFWASVVQASILIVLLIGVGMVGLIVLFTRSDLTPASQG